MLHPQKNGGCIIQINIDLNPRKPHMMINLTNINDHIRSKNLNLPL